MIKRNAKQRKRDVGGGGNVYFIITICTISNYLQTFKLSPKCFYFFPRLTNILLLTFKSRRVLFNKWAFRVILKHVHYINTFANETCKQRWKFVTEDVKNVRNYICILPSLKMWNLLLLRNKEGSAWIMIPKKSAQLNFKSFSCFMIKCNYATCN